MDTVAAPFVWYELMTPDLEAAERFYGAVIGWDVTDSGSAGPRYSLARAGGQPVAGMMALTQAEAGRGIPPHWLGYVGSADVSDSVSRITGAGGRVLHEPEQIPGVGTFAVVADPQGAPLGLFRMENTPPAPPSPDAAGYIGWHELSAVDNLQAWEFYSAQFGWTRAHDMDMGAHGVYRIFSMGGMPVGGMVTRMNPETPPHWLFYINVDDIDAAIGRLKEQGGSVLHGPIQVPGGSWIAQARDPQGAYFAVVGSRGVTG